MFQLVDSDGGGSIGRDEVLDLMRLVGYQCTEEEVDDMISEIDEDGNIVEQDWGENAGEWPWADWGDESDNRAEGDPSEDGEPGAEGHQPS